MIEDSIRQAAIREVYGKFPQFYPTAKDAIVRNRVAEYKKQNKATIRKEAADLYRQLKDRYQDDSGQTYLMELDCWHWARYVANVVKFGHSGDELIYGRNWDMLMLAPAGSYLLWQQFLYYISAFFYKAFAVFKPVPLFTFLFYLPLFFAAIFITVLYAFSFSFGRHIGAVISCLFVGLAPIFLHRSTAGWFDTDILILLFPLLVAWTYILSYGEPVLRNRLLWVGFSSFWVGLFCFTWTHWWFIAAIIIIYEFLAFGHLAVAWFYFKRKQPDLFKKHLVSLSAFLLFSLAWVMVLAGTQPVVVLYNQITQALILNKPLMTSIWPNVYSTVGELRKLNVSEIVRSSGGIWLLLPSLVCMLVLLARAVFYPGKYAGLKRMSVLIMFIWLAAMLFASSRGVRFIVFILLPLGVSLGWVMDEIFEYFRSRNNFKAASAVIAACAVFCGAAVNNGYRTAKVLYPLIDDTWYKVLNIVNEKTGQDTIINSWWDFGDWFKVVARRRVIFDGQSQHTPQAYWMAKAMLTTDENKAVGILRMLNNGGNKAFEVINAQLNNPLLSVMLLEYVIPMHPDKAQETLARFIPQDTVVEIMKLLFYRPANAVFVVDYTMPFKMGAISYLGGWSFPKVYIAQNFIKLEKDRIVEYLTGMGQDGQETNRFYQEVFLITTKNLDEWLSNRLQFYSGIYSGRADENNNAVFDNGFIFNPIDQSIKSGTGQIPRSLLVANDEGMSEKPLPNPNVPYSILVFKTDSGYKSVLLDSQLGASIFTRLYFLNGKGLRHFLPFIDVENSNNYIRVFNIAW